MRVPVFFVICLEQRAVKRDGPLLILADMKCQREECFCTDFNRHLCKDYRADKPKPKGFAKRKPTGEKAMFEDIWAKKVHVCESCGKHLREFNVSYFSHIIAKGIRKDLRLDPNNIVLECIDCHNTWGNGKFKDKMLQHSWERKLAYIAANDKELYAKYTFLIDKHL